MSVARALGAAGRDLAGRARGRWLATGVEWGSRSPKAWGFNGGSGGTGPWESRAGACEGPDGCAGLSARRCVLRGRAWQAWQAVGGAGAPARGGGHPRTSPFSHWRTWSGPWLGLLGQGKRPGCGTGQVGNIGPARRPHKAARGAGASGPGRSRHGVPAEGQNGNGTVRRGPRPGGVPGPAQPRCLVAFPRQSWVTRRPAASSRRWPSWGLPGPASGCTGVARRSPSSGPSWPLVSGGRAPRGGGLSTGASHRAPATEATPRPGQGLPRRHRPLGHGAGEAKVTPREGLSLGVGHSVSPVLSGGPQIPLR